MYVYIYLCIYSYIYNYMYMHIYLYFIYAYIGLFVCCLLSTSYGSKIYVYKYACVHALFCGIQSVVCKPYKQALTHTHSCYIHTYIWVYSIQCFACVYVLAKFILHLRHKNIINKKATTITNIKPKYTPEKEKKQTNSEFKSLINWFLDAVLQCCCGSCCCRC